MKKTLLSLFAILMATVAYAGDGTKENPFTIAEVKTNCPTDGSAINDVYVKGYNLDITGNGIINGTLTLGDDTIKWYNTKVSNITFVGSTSGIILKNFRNGIIDNVRFSVFDLLL